MSTCVLLRSALIRPPRQTNRGCELRLKTANGRPNSALGLQHAHRTPINLRRNIITAASEGYYQNVDGKKMDRAMLKIAEECTKGLLYLAISNRVCASRPFWFQDCGAQAPAF
eukprot:5935007-Pyramimonas_sp.AAC.1